MTPRPLLLDGHGVESFQPVMYRNGTPYQTLSSRTYSDYFRSTKGWDIPNFYARRNAGELLPFTPFYQTSRSGQRSGTRTVTSSLGLDTYPNGYVTTDNGWLVDEVWLADQVANAGLPHHGVYTQRAASQIYSAGWDALTFAAEIHRLRQMFRNLLRKILSITDTQAALNAWLEYRYGWRTLYYDIQDITQLVNSVNEKRRRYSQRAGDSFNWAVHNTSDLSTSTYSHIITTQTVINVSLRGSVVADIVPPKIQLNPIITAWELTRLSFVMDWLVNVGQALEALSFLAYKQNYVASGGTLISATRTTSDEFTYTSGPNSGGHSVTGSHVVELTKRSPSSVSFQPYFNVNLDAFKVLDLVALVFQRIRR